MRLYPAPPVDDPYTDRPTKLRIVKDDGNDQPWQLDGIDVETGAYTVACYNFATFEQAVAAINDFIGYELPMLRDELAAIDSIASVTRYA